MTGTASGDHLKGAAARVAAALAAAGIDSAVREMPSSTRTAQEAAAAVRCELGQIVKSLVFRTAGGEPVLVLVGGADRVDEKRLADVVGAPVERPDADWVRSVTGFAIGGIPPIGHAQPLPPYVDDALLAWDEVWAAAGTPHAVFPVAPGDLVRATAATVVTVRA